MRAAVVVTAALLAAACPRAGADDPPRAKSAAPKPAAGQRPARPGDEKAIREAVAAFAAAFNKGDAKAIAALFTEDAESTDEAGNKLKGRTAIAGQFASLFEASPGDKIELTTDSVRFLADEVAVEEGRSKVTPAAGGAEETGRYTVLYVKQGGRSLQAGVREHPDHAVTHHDRLKDLEWMVGDWVDENASAVVFTSCQWAENKNFLLRSFTIQVGGKPAVTGSQRVGWDPLTKQIKSWVFDSEGGHGEGLWSRNGDEWVVKATGVLKDGRLTSSTQIITVVNKHMVRWKSVDRTEGGHAVADVEEIVLVRKPPKPQQ